MTPIMEPNDRHDSADTLRIVWHEGSRDELRPLFELADDSATAIDRSINLGRILVARAADGRLMGHIQLVTGPARGLYEIKTLAVLERDQRRGIGRRLVDRALAICRDENGNRVIAVTAMADIGNLRFYQRCGFRAEAVIPDAFTPAQGYPPDLVADGIPVRDAIRFSYDLRPRDRDTGKGQPAATIVVQHTGGRPWHRRSPFALTIRDHDGSRTVWLPSVAGRRP